MSEARVVTSYLEAINVTQTVRERIGQIVQEYNDLFAIDISRVFISETVDKEGEPVYESLWLIDEAANIWGEARSFMSDNDFDMTIASYIVHAKFQFEAYSPGGDANRSSRGHLTFRLSNGLSGELKASGRNVHEMYRLIQEVINPRMQEIQHSPGLDIV